MEPNFNSNNFYERLGLSKNADENAIKKAYKKYAKKYHPDKSTGNKEECINIFKKITEAYEILSKPEERQKYDLYGRDGLKPNVPNVNPFDIVNNFFSGFNFFPNNNIFNKNNNNEKISIPVKHAINVDLKTLYNGKITKLNLKRKHIYSPENLPIDINHYMTACTHCNNCNGVGRVITTRQTSGFFTQQTTTCNNCSGIGSILKPGYSIKEHNEIIEVNIEPGTPNGAVFIYPNKGDMIPGLPIADLHVIINESTIPNIYRDGNDLHVNYTISLEDALLNNIIMFKHLDDRILNLYHDYVISPNMIRKVKKEGMPSPTGKGDLYFHFTVSFPTTLGKEVKKRLSKIFTISPTNSKGCLVNLV